jgi:hypothetical protein
MTKGGPKLNPGRVLIAFRAMKALAEHYIREVLTRRDVFTDWGDCCREDWQYSNQALLDDAVLKNQKAHDVDRPRPFPSTRRCSPAVRLLAPAHHASPWLAYPCHRIICQNGIRPAACPRRPPTFSVGRGAHGTKFGVIAEAVGHAGKRATTTVPLPDEF